MEGAILILLSDNENQLKDDVEKYHQFGVEVNYHLINLDDDNNIRETLEKVLHSYGKIDFLVNSAGMGQNKTVVDQLIALNLAPTFCIVFLQKFMNL